MRIPRPNLFTYATSELSQDAFLCWLLEWADPTHRETDAGLHRVARAFLDAMFARAKVTAPDANTKVDIRKQVKAADVVAEVGEHHVLVIEDKTHTGNHSDQLNRYREALGKRYTGRELVCVYGGRQAHILASLGTPTLYQLGNAMFGLDTPLVAIDHVTLTVSDVERSRHFYLETLGLQPGPDWTGEVTMLRAGETFIGLAHWMAGQTDQNQPPITIHHIAFRVGRKTFEAAEGLLAAHGISIDRVDDLGLCQSLYFKDPDGHQLELVCYEIDGDPERMPVMPA